jgi:hypothetical protein
LKIKAIWKTEHKDELMQNLYSSCYFILMLNLVSRIEGKHAMRVFGKRMLCRILGLKREDVTAD